LTRQVYLDYLEHGPNRLKEIANQLFNQEKDFLQKYHLRVKNLQPNCLCCNRPVPETGVWPKAFFLENETGQFSGFIEENCLLDLLLRNFYPELRSQEQRKLLHEILIGTTDRPLLLLQKTPLSPEQNKIELFRLNQSGKKISGRSIKVKKSERSQKKGPISLLQLFDNGSIGDSDQFQQLLLRQTGKNPVDLLKQHDYLEWQTLFNQVQIDRTLEVAAE